MTVLWGPLVHCITGKILLAFTDRNFQQQVVSSISRNVEILILTSPSGPVAQAGSSQSSDGWQTKRASGENLLSTPQPVTVGTAAPPAQRRMRKEMSSSRRCVFEFQYFTSIQVGEVNLFGHLSQSDSKTNDSFVGSVRVVQRARPRWGTIREVKPAREGRVSMAALSMQGPVSIEATQRSPPSQGIRSLLWEQRRVSLRNPSSPKCH